MKYVNNNPYDYRVNPLLEVQKDKKRQGSKMTKSQVSKKRKEKSVSFLNIYLNELNK